MSFAEDHSISQMELAAYHAQVIGELEARVDELTGVVDTLLLLQAERADEQAAVARALAECRDAQPAAPKDGRGQGHRDTGKRRRATDRCAEARR